MELPPRATKPRSGAAAADSAQASDREDEATAVDIVRQPKEADTCSQLPQQDDSGKVGLGSQLPKSVADVTAAECLELFKQIAGGGESDDEQCAAMVRATLTATEDDHESLIQQLEKEASAEGLRMSDHDKGIEEIQLARDTGIFNMRGHMGQRHAQAWDRRARALSAIGRAAAETGVSCRMGTCSVQVRTRFQDA